MEQAIARELRGSDIGTAPAVADFDNDGRRELIVSTHNDDIHCLDFQTGKTKWRRALLTAPVTINNDCSRFRSQVIDLGQDINGDGFRDLVATSSLYSFHLFSGKDGCALGRLHRFGPIATPVIYKDLNADQRPDFLFFNGDQLVVVSDVAAYFKKSIRQPKYFTNRHQDALLLQMGDFNKLLQRRDYRNPATRIFVNTDWAWLHIWNLYRGIWALDQAKYGLAVKILEKNPPGFADSRFLLAIAYLNNKSGGQGLKIMEQVLAASVWQFDACYRQYSHLLTKDGHTQLQQVLPGIIQAVKVDRLLDSSYQAAKILKNTPEYLAALELYLKYGDRSSPLYQERKSEYLNRALNLFNEIQYIYLIHKSFDILDHALEIIPDRPELLSNRGQLYIMSKLSFKNGLEDLQKSLQLQPNQPDVLQFRARLYHAMRDYRAALSDFYKALQIQPDNVALYQSIVATHLFLGQKQESLLRLQQMEMRLQHRIEENDRLINTVLKALAQGEHINNKNRRATIGMILETLPMKRRNNKTDMWLYTNLKALLNQ